MIRCLFIIMSSGLILWSSLSCSTDRMDPPETLLDDSLLVNILADSYILNAAFNQTAGTVKDSISKSFQKQIFDKYQISQDVLDQNVEWRYAEGRMDSIFNMMMERMNYLEGHISSKTDNQK